MSKPSQVPGFCSPQRSERIERASTQPFDILIIGGGIHGVALAQVASAMHYKTLLLEQNDYASGTSSRSSKMAHGGLRYLEMFDFQQVFEGITCREDLFVKAPHLVKPERFLIPVRKRDWWFRLKLHIGLRLYDLMVKNPTRRHRWISRSLLESDVFGESSRDLQGAFEYTDGLMKDARLVYELLVSAEQAGCCAVNHARVIDVKWESKESSMEVVWEDSLDQQQHCSTSTAVFNCAGPWAPYVQDYLSPKSRYPVKYSRGTHLIFSKPWKHPSLFLPLAEQGRYYFVWPHASGTMVGTTEREVEALAQDPIPSKDEEDEILARLARDLPHQGLTKDSLVSSFAGIRILPLRHKARRVGGLSRKHIWEKQGAMFSLIGGKYTTFAWTVREGMKLFLQQCKDDSRDIPSPIQGLPGYIIEEHSRELIIALQERHPSLKAGICRAVERLGRQVMRYYKRAEAWQELCPGVLVLEVLHAIECEHATSVEGVLRWRLELANRETSNDKVRHAVEVLLANFGESNH